MMFRIHRKPFGNIWNPASHFFFFLSFSSPSSDSSFHISSSVFQLIALGLFQITDLLGRWIPPPASLSPTRLTYATFAASTAHPTLLCGDTPSRGVLAYVPHHTESSPRVYKIWNTKDKMKMERILILRPVMLILRLVVHLILRLIPLRLPPLVFSLSFRLLLSCCHLLVSFFV